MRYRVRVKRTETREFAAFVEAQSFEEAEAKGMASAALMDWSDGRRVFSDVEFVAVSSGPEARVRG